MKKFEGLLFCTDVDGTLYSNNRTVSKQNIDAIEYFKSQGGLFTFITGRVPQTSGAVYKSICPNAPFGFGNGGGLYDFNSKKIMDVDILNQEAVELVREVDIQLPEIGIHYNTENNLYINKYNEVWKVFETMPDLSLIYCNYEDVKEPVMKVVFGHNDEKQIQELEKLLRSHPKADMFDFVRSEATLFELLPKGVNKGAGLCKLAKHLGISMEKTIAVGDYNNDITMVKTAKLGFAVENAVPQLKAVADYITVSNEQHAIAAIIDGLDRGIYNI